MTKFLIKLLLLINKSSAILCLFIGTKITIEHGFNGEAWQYALLVWGVSFALVSVLPFVIRDKKAIARRSSDKHV